jgi:hypothetical protein
MSRGQWRQCAKTKLAFDLYFPVWGETDHVEAQTFANAPTLKFVAALQRDDRATFGQAIALTHRQPERARPFEERRRRARAAHRDQGEQREALAHRLHDRDQATEIFRDENQRRDPVRRNGRRHRYKVWTEGIGEPDVSRWQRDIRASRQNCCIEARNILKQDRWRQQRQMPPGMAFSNRIHYRSRHSDHMVGGQTFALRRAGRTRGETDLCGFRVNRHRVVFVTLNNELSRT